MAKGRNVEGSVSQIANIRFSFTIFSHTCLNTELLRSSESYPYCQQVVDQTIPLVVCAL